MAPKLEKRIIPGKVRTVDHKTFKVEKGDGAAEDVLLHFARPVDYRVVRLSTKGLPRNLGRKKIHWLSYFGILGADGEYMREVNYTAFLTVPRGADVLVFDHKGFHKPKGLMRGRGKAGGKEIVHIEMHTGDPGFVC